ncbi:MAG: preprotein translocase subunit SecG, partial [Verrucomicrobiales bacterium]
MILADFLNISITLVVISHVVVSLLLVLVILMQRPKAEGLGSAFGGGVTDNVWGARTTDVLQKGTVYLGSLFFILALVLAILVGKDNARRAQRADVESVAAATQSVETPAADEAAAAEAELSEAEKMAAELENLGGNEGAEEEKAEEKPAAEETEEKPAAEETPAEESAPAAESEAPAAEESAP